MNQEVDLESGLLKQKLIKKYDKEYKEKNREGNKDGSEREEEAKSIINCTCLLGTSFTTLICTCLLWLIIQYN